MGDGMQLPQKRKMTLRDNMKKLPKLIFPSIAILSLSACLVGCTTTGEGGASPHFGGSSPMSTDTANSKQAVDTNTDKSSTSTRKNAKLSLEKQGVKVNQIGQQIQVIIPEAYLFEPASANLVPASESILKDLSEFVNTYQIEKIEVAAYVDSIVGNGVSQDKNAKSLTTAQADAVSSFLWANGVDVRYIYGRGYGGSDPVAPNSTSEGRNMNKRITVNFEYIAGDN